MCVRACVRACVRVCVRGRVRGRVNCVTHYSVRLCPVVMFHVQRFEPHSHTYRDSTHYAFIIIIIIIIRHIRE